VNHNLRAEEIPAEIEFCGKVCERLGVNFVIKSIDVTAYYRERRMNKQEAARELRYQAFQDAANDVNAGKIALAHNADDQAETLFMRLVRGSGPSGLSGMPVRRGKIIRPLLEIERQEIEEYLAGEKIRYVTDSSNLRADYFRNMLRLSVMPLMKRVNPSLVRSLLHTISIMQDEERYFELAVTKALMKLISRKTDKRIELFLAPMEAMDPVILRRVLRRAIQETDTLRGIQLVHIEDVIGLIKKGRPGDRLHLPHNIRAIKEYALLTITSEEPIRIADCALPVPGETAVRGAGMVILTSLEDAASDTADGRTVVYLDAEKMSLPLVVRAREKGDFFYPLGFGRRKKLQDFFVDMKIPRDERDSIPIVVSGNSVVWVAGYRADERFRVTEKTKKFMRLGIVKGKY
jgi:tRNA(Ile)-lysidine synthase